MRLDATDEPACFRGSIGFPPRLSAATGVETPNHAIRDAADLRLANLREAKLGLSVLRPPT